MLRLTNSAYLGERARSAELAGWYGGVKASYATGK